MIWTYAERVVDVQGFLARAGSSLARFRYFETRSVEAISKHLVTLLGYDPPGAGLPISYGHIAVDEQGEYWLGTCVAESHIGRGFGQQMVEVLIEHAERRGVTEIHLSVDVDNAPARKLYEKFGFVIYRSEAHRDRAGVLYMKRSRMDTLGSLVDKLATTNAKLFISQEDLYAIRRMESFEDFKAKYMSSDEAARGLWERLKATCDLNVQRAALIQEVDEKVVQIARDAATGRDLDAGAHIQRQHKTY